LVGSIFREWGLKYAQIKKGPFWGPEIGYNKGYIGFLKAIPLTNHWPGCIDILHKATVGQGDSVVRK